MVEKKNISLGSGKNRIMLLIAIVILAMLVSVGYWQSRSKAAGPQASAAVQEAPKIDSTPGVGRAPPREYVKLQEQQNAQEVIEAQKKGTSAVPTIVRASYLGDDAGKSGANADSSEPGVSGCDLIALRRAKQAGVSAVELRCKGCSASALRASGYAVGELREAGFTAAHLKDAGFNAQELKAAGFTAQELKAGGFKPKDLVSAGFSISEIKQAGFGAAELKAAGVTVQQLKDAGFSAQELKKAGVSARELVSAGFSPAELKKAGFSQIELRAAGLSAADLAKVECDAAVLGRLRAAGASTDKLKSMGCAPGDLRSAGYSAAELKAMGFSAQELKKAGFASAELKAAGYTANDLKEAGFSSKDLKASGYSANDLKNAGYSAGELKNIGFSAEELKDAGFSPAVLRKAGFTVDELKRAGFAANNLKEAGYSDGELARAGMSTALSQDQTIAAAVGQEGMAASGVATRNTASTAQVVSMGGNVSTSGAAQTDPAAAALERLQRMQAAQISDQERKQKLDQMRQGMTTQASELLSSWSPPAPQAMVVGLEEVVQPGESVDAAAQTGVSGKTANGQTAEMPPGTYDTIKAGTIMFGVLDVGINSDEQSPILATIVEGQLRGAKLMGQFTRQEKRVLVTFNLMNVPKLPNSLPINIVAIDPNTARTMLADRVDSHYMLRYGTLFASSFISGLADAVGKSGSSTVVSTSGITVSQPPLDTTKLVVTGLGQVGKQYSSSLNSNFTTPPTVYVNPGSSVGMLLMTDLKVPKSVDELVKK